MLLRQLNPTDWKPEVGEALRGSLVVVTGSSGVGKSYLVDTVCAELRVPWLDLESFGSFVQVHDGRTCFYVDVPKLMSYLDTWEGREMLIVGYCDNLSEVIAHLARQFLLSFYIVTCSPATHKRICTARYFDLKAQGLELKQQKWYARARLPISRLTIGMGEAVWGHLCTFAYGLYVAGELQSIPEGFIPNIAHSDFRWRKWASDLAKIEDLLISSVEASTYKVALITNVIPEKVRTIRGWYPVRGGIRHVE